VWALSDATVVGTLRRTSRSRDFSLTTHGRVKVVGLVNVSKLFFLSMSPNCSFFLSEPTVAADRCLLTKLVRTSWSGNTWGLGVALSNDVRHRCVYEFSRHTSEGGISHITRRFYVNFTRGRYIGLGWATRVDVLPVSSAPQTDTGKKPRVYYSMKSRKWMVGWHPQADWLRDAHTSAPHLSTPRTPSHVRRMATTQSTPFSIKDIPTQWYVE